MSFYRTKSSSLKGKSSIFKLLFWIVNNFNYWDHGCPWLRIFNKKQSYFYPLWEILKLRIGSGFIKPLSIRRVRISKEFILLNLKPSLYPILRKNWRKMKNIYRNMKWPLLFCLKSKKNNPSKNKKVFCRDITRKRFIKAFN